MSVRTGRQGETFPADAAQKLGVKGKNAVVYFYGADGSPSCTKEAAAFDARMADFKGLGCVCNVFVHVCAMSISAVAAFGQKSRKIWTLFMPTEPGPENPKQHGAHFMRCLV
jgi:hypothetical protein